MAVKLYVFGFTFVFTRRKDCNHVENLEDKLFSGDREGRIIKHTSGMFGDDMNCESTGESCHSCVDIKKIKCYVTAEIRMHFQGI